ncbi:hypothetical protein HP532_21000 [Pseudomonas sp. CrR25]|nr:hypothetical protein [Pseudomonas sp. CrR25]
MRYWPLALLLPLLSACEPKVEPAKTEPAKTAAAPTATSLAPAAAAKPQPVAVHPTPVAAAPRAAADGQRAMGAGPTPAKPGKTTATQEAPKSKLDLSLPPEVLEQLQAEDARDEALAPLLPPLFEEKQPAVSPFQLSGRLITNEGDDDYWNSVDGAELQFEFKR